MISISIASTFKHQRWASSAATLGPRRARATAPHPDCKRSRAPLAVLRRRLSPSCRRLPFCAAGCEVSVVFRPTQTTDVRPSSAPRDASAGMQGVARATAPDPDYKRSQCAPDCFASQAFAIMQAPAFLRRIDISAITPVCSPNPN